MESCAAPPSSRGQARSRVGLAHGNARADAGALGPAESYGESVFGLRDAFYQKCYGEGYQPDDMVLPPISVSSLLADLPSPMKEAPTRVDAVPRGLPQRRLERAIFEAVANCAAFVALCVGDAPALTPARALEVLRGTSKRIVDDRLEGFDDADAFGALSVGDTDVGDTDGGDEVLGATRS